MTVSKRLNGVKELYGLVLAGGKSTRMGSDKGSIIYHKSPQREHLADLMQPFCDMVFISCRAEQEIISAYPLILDKYENVGPIGAILTAFEHYSDIAWLVVACDLPLINRSAIEFLIKNRNLNTIATAFQHPDNQQIEPLAAIWEAASYPILQAYLKKGHKSPKRLLENNQVHRVQPFDKRILKNINDARQRKELKDWIDDNH